MREEEDLSLRSKPSLGAVLEALSIEELEERIETLKGEIATCEAIAHKKRQAKAAADAVFGTPKS